MFEIIIYLTPIYSYSGVAMEEDDAIMMNLILVGRGRGVQSNLKIIG